MTKLLAIVLLVLPVFCIGQDFEGKITYEVKYTSLDSVHVKMSGLRDQTITEYLGPGKIRIDQNTSIGKQSAVYRVADTSYFILLNLEDGQIAITMPKEFALSSGRPDPEIKYKRWKRKKIAGYKCRLAIVTYPNEKPISVYYTKKLPAELNQKFEGLKGYPLQFSFILDNAMENYKAVSIEEKDVDDALFEIPATSVQMTLEEFQGSIGQ